MIQAENECDVDMVVVKEIMDEVWRTQKAMLKKQPLMDRGRHIDKYIFCRKLFKEYILA